MTSYELADIRTSDELTSVRATESYEKIPQEILIEALDFHLSETRLCMDCPLYSNPNCSGIIKKFSKSLIEAHQKKEDQEEKIKNLQEALMRMTETSQTEYNYLLSQLKLKLSHELFKLCAPAREDKKVALLIKSIFDEYRF